MNLQGLRFIGQIAEIQRQTRSIAAGEEARVFSSAMTGAATTTLSSLLPKSSAVHARAITRSSPLKSPMGNVTVPSP